MNNLLHKQLCFPPYFFFQYCIDINVILFIIHNHFDYFRNIFLMCSCKYVCMEYDGVDDVPKDMHSNSPLDF